MPDQNTHTVTNVGDTLDEATLQSLPIGAVVRDKEDDTYDVQLIGHYVMRGDGTSWSPSELARNWGPVRLVSLPRGASSMGQPDTYQQARLALRDRYGTEPKIDDVWSIVRSMEHNDFTATEAITAQENLTKLLNPEQPAPASGQDRALAEAFLRTYRTQETELRHAREKVQQLDAKVSELRNMGERDREELRRLHPFEGEAKELRRVTDHPFFHSIVVDEDNSLVDNILAYLDERTQATTAAPTEPGNADFGVVVFVKNEEAAGLARLRAHAALDALLDQHGISR